MELTQERSGFFFFKKFFYVSTFLVSSFSVDALINGCFVLCLLG